MFLSGGEVSPLPLVDNTPPRIKAMLVMAQERRIPLLEALESCGIDVLPVCDCNEAQRMREAQPPVQVVVTDAVLHDGDWRRVLAVVAQGRANIEVIVCSRLGDYNLWIDVLEHGGYDVLVEPFDQAEVRRIVEAAAAKNYVRSPAQAINHRPKVERPAGAA
jgi:DNA-binding NtrC family response regulator